MTEKAQRELYLAIRRAKEKSTKKDFNTFDFQIQLYLELKSLLTAPQFTLDQLFK